MGQAKQADSERRSGSSSGFRSTQGQRLWLRLKNDELLLRDGELVIGRSAMCHVRLEGPLVSREHARLTVSDRQVVLEDLGSRNGVFVNGTRIEEPTVVGPGSDIVVGGETLEIVVRDQVSPGADPKLRETVTSMPAIRPEDYPTIAEDDPEQPESTVNADGFTLLTGVVDKMLALQRPDEAERIVSNHLQTLLGEATRGVPVQRATAQAAAEYAVKLAAATCKGKWIDYVFDLYLAARMVVPVDVVDRLYSAVRRAGNIDRRRLREYIEYLEARASGLSPVEKFALQRIEGLERLAASL